MASPVNLYLKEMHNNVGYFATWLPATPIRVGDFGVLEGQVFRRMGSLSELGIPNAADREGLAQDMSYSASAKRTTSASAGVSSVVPAIQGEVSIAFTSQGGYIFEALGIRSLEIADRLATTQRVLDVYRQGTWQKEWLLIDSVYSAASATILVSLDATSEIALKASGDIPLGPLPLADPKLGLTVSSSSGRIVQVVAKSGLSPLYSGLKIRDSWFDSPSLVPVRGSGPEAATQSFTRLSIDELLDS